MPDGLENQNPNELGPGKRLAAQEAVHRAAEAVQLLVLNEEELSTGKRRGPGQRGGGGNPRAGARAAGSGPGGARARAPPRRFDPLPEGRTRGEKSGFVKNKECFQAAMAIGQRMFWERGGRTPLDPFDFANELLRNEAMAPFDEYAFNVQTVSTMARNISCRGYSRNSFLRRAGLLAASEPNFVYEEYSQEMDRFVQLAR